MTIRKGRIVRAGQPMQALALRPAPGSTSESKSESTSGSTSESTSGSALGKASTPGTFLERGHIVRRERVEVAQRTARLDAEARERAALLIREAEREADRIRQEARKQGLDEATAKLAASWLQVQRREAEADIASLDRCVTIARLLAERLVGESLQLEPKLVASLAREAMHHLWRGHRVTIHAHPQDVPALQQHVATFGMPPERIEIVQDSERARGSMRFTSEFGELDGEIGPQLDRLAEAIRQELGGR